MQINKDELSLCEKKIMASNDPHAEAFKRFVKDLPEINFHVERIPYLSKSDRREVDSKASWFLASACAALSQHSRRLKDTKIIDTAAKLYKMAENLLFEVLLMDEHHGSSYKKEPSALGWSFIRDSTILGAMMEGKPQYVFLEMCGMRAQCVPIKEMKEFTVVPYDIPVVVGVVNEGVDEKLTEWFREQDRVDCEKFLYDSEEFGKKWAEEGKHIVGEKTFNEVVSKIISSLYDEDRPIRIVDIGIGNGSSIRRLFDTLRERESKNMYQRILDSVEIIGVDKFRAMSKYSFETVKNLGINNYELIECDMVDLKPEEKDVVTFYLLSANTRNNLDEDKRRGVDKNIVQNLKRGDYYFRNEYYPPTGRELETTLSYANFPPVHACLDRAIKNKAVALVIQYNPNHPEGGNVEFFSVYRNKPVYRIHFRSVRRNIDTIKKDGPLLGCNIYIHVNPEEHMVTSILSK